jgi:transposase
MGIAPRESFALPRPKLTLDALQLQQLTACASGLDARLVKRSRIILLCSEGKPADQVSALLGIAVPTVYKWCRRFSQNGMAGLYDRPRSGQPLRLPKERRDEIATLARLEKPPNGARWTIRTAARHLQVTEHQIRKIWSDAGIKPHE